MAKYEFRGTRYDQGALASALAGTVQAALVDAELRARAGQELGSAFASFGESVGQGLTRRYATKFARDESALDRALRTSEREAGERFQREMADKEIAESRSRFERQLSEEFNRRQEENRIEAELNRLRALGQGAALGVEQGYPAPQLYERLNQAYERSPILNQGGGVGPRGPGVPPPGPPGFAIGPQQSDPLYQSLMQEGGGGGLFEGLTPLPQAQNIETRKYEDQLKKARIKEELNAFFMSPKGQKALTVPVQVKNRDAYDLPETMLPLDFEAAVQRLWPAYAPKKVQTEIGKPPEEDRAAFDALVKWLNEEREELIPMSAPMRELAGQLIEKYEQSGIEPGLIDEVLNEFYEEQRGFASSPDQARQMALARRLEQIKKMERDPQPAESVVQAQSFEDLLGAAAKAQTTERTVNAPTQPFRWTNETAGQLFNYARLPRELQIAANVPGGLTVAPQPDGSWKFEDLPGFAIPQRWNELLNSTLRGSVLEAGSAAGTEKVSPSDIEKGAAGREMKGKPKPAEPQAAAPAQSAIEAYRALQQKKAPAAKEPVEKRLNLPRVLRLVGDDTALLRLLLGAGGGP